MPVLGKGFMLLHLSTWQDVESYLTTSRGIIMPIGSTEQHGPNGLIGTDAICAEAVAKGVGEATGAIVGPTINVGMALHHLAFPGSMSLKPSTMILVIRDYVTTLAKAGFRKFFFVNGHGGNIAILKAAFSECYEHLAELGIDEADQVQCVVSNWFMGSGVYRLAKELYGDAEGSHATPSEVALTQFLYPESIKQVSFDPEAPKGHKIYSAVDFRRRYPDGRMGSNPALATPEHGKQFYEVSVEETMRSYLEFLNAI
jgi:creatinine amidohydrolase